MRLIALGGLRDFWQKPERDDAEQPLRGWFKEAEKADRAPPADIRKHYVGASFINDNRVVFNIGGNKYRLVVRAMYRSRAAHIRFIGAHADYDRIDADRI